MLTKNVE